MKHKNISYSADGIMLSLLFLFGSFGCISTTKEEEELQKAIKDFNTKWGIDDTQSRSNSKSVGSLGPTSNDEIDIAISRSLGDVGPSVVDSLPFLLDLIDSPHPQVREWAAWAIGKIGDPTGLSVEKLCRLLKDDNDDVRIATALALGRIGVPAKVSVSALISALQDQNQGVVQNATWSLGQVGVDNSEARKGLVSLLNHTNASISANAFQSIAQIGSAKEISPEYMKLMNSPDEIKRSNAAFALGSSQESPEIVTALIKALEDNSNKVRGNAAASIGKISKQDVAIMALCKVLKDIDPQVKQVAAKALVQIGRNAIPYLVKIIMYDYSLELKKLAASCLAEIGSCSLPELLICLKNGDDVSKGLTAAIISKYGPDGRNAVAELRNNLKNENLDVVQNTIVALWQIGDYAKEAVPDLVSAMNDKHAIIRQVAAGAVGGIGPNASNAVPALLSLLNDQDSSVRQYAAVSLGQIRGSEAAQALIKILKGSKDKELRVRACSALGHPEFGKEEIIKELISMYAEPDIRYKTAAAGSLSRIGMPAMQFVLRALQDQETMLYAAASISRMNPPPIAKAIDLIDSPDPCVKIASIWVLAEFGENAHIAITKLCQLTERSKVAAPAPSKCIELIKGQLRDAGNKLNLAGEADFNQLVDSVNSEIVVPLYAISAILKIKKNSELMVDHLVRNLNDENPLLVFLSLGALAALDGKANQAFPALVNRIRAPKLNSIKLMALISIGKCAAPEQLMKIYDDGLVNFQEVSLAFDYMGPRAISFLLKEKMASSGDRAKKLGQIILSMCKSVNDLKNPALLFEESIKLQ